MVRNRSNAEHYSWGAGCEGWHLLASPELSVIQERMPPGTAESRHFHRSARQLFFVLAGALEIDRGAELFELSEQDTLEVPPGVLHTVRNAGEHEALFLVVSSPASHGDRVEV